MTQNPTSADKPFDGDVLAQLLVRAQSDAAFRDRLLHSPAEVLKERGLSASPKWVAFFARLNAANFEEAIQYKIRNDSEGEAEAEAGA